MTGADVEVICGEWEVGNVPPDVSGELYNVILQVKEIRRHPGFEINQGVLRTNYLQNDLSVIFVKVNIVNPLILIHIIFCRSMRKLKRK